MWQNRAILKDAEFLLNGNLGELERLTLETGCFCRAFSLGEEIEFELNLVLEELFTNAIRHGGCEGMEQAVRVRLQVAEGAVLVEFADRGKAFDPASAPRPDLAAPLAARSIGGLGLHLVRSLVEDLRYHRSGDWNCITMRRPVERRQA